MYSRHAISNQVLSRPNRTEIQTISDWLEDNRVEFQYMISVICSRKPATFYKSAVKDFMAALQEYYFTAELSHLYCLESYPVINLHLFVNGNRILSKTLIEDFFNHGNLNAVITDYKSIGGVRYAFKQSGYNSGFEYDFSPNVLRVRLK
jgi:hypothetical protein